MSGNFTLFKSGASGGGSGSSDYVKEAFPDFTLDPTENTGLTSSSTNNPLGYFFGNDSSVLFGAKRLYIEDISLLADKSKWINRKPTYEVIWSENYFAAKAYVFGNILISKKDGGTVLTMRDVGDGFAVAGIIRKVGFLFQPNTLINATAQAYLDGVAQNSIDFSNLNSDSNTRNEIIYYSQVNDSSLATEDIHEFRVVAQQVNSFQIVGVEVYHENSGGNIKIRPGSNFVNKTLVNNTTGASIGLPSYGSSLGGNLVLAANALAGFSLFPTSATTVTSIATGTTGTNLLTVLTGEGVNFSPGDGIVAQSGSSYYVGSVLQISTDTLTVSPTLAFGVSGFLYRSWQSGPTQAISSTLYESIKQLGFSNEENFSNPFLQPEARWAVWGVNIGTTTQTVAGPTFSIPANGINFIGASGFLQIEGYFNAADMQVNGVGIFGASILINGVPAYVVNTGQTGIVNYSLLTNSGYKWNQIRIHAGQSISPTMLISSIGLYQRRFDTGVTYGLLSRVDTLEAYVPRTSDSSQNSLGTYCKLFSDQLYLKGGWTRATNVISPGGHFYSGTSTNSVLRVGYYGKEFTLLGTAGSSAILFLDGTSIAVNFNSPITPSTEDWHVVQYQHQGGTSVIEGFEWKRSHAELDDLRRFKKELEPQTFEDPYFYFLPNSVGAGNFFTAGTIQVDNYNAYNTTTGEYVCPIGGIYQVSAHCSEDTANRFSLLRIYINGIGTALYGGNYQNAWTQSIQVSFSVKCKPGDKIQIYFSSSGSTNSTDAQVTIARVGD